MKLYRIKYCKKKIHSLSIQKKYFRGHWMWKAINFTEWKYIEKETQKICHCVLEKFNYNIIVIFRYIQFLKIHFYHKFNANRCIDFLLLFRFATKQLVDSTCNYDESIISDVLYFTFCKWVWKKKKKIKDSPIFFKQNCPFFDRLLSKVMHIKVP